MELAIVNTTAAPLYDRCGDGAVLADEVLYGMVVEVLERPAEGWRRVRTHYRYEGFVPADCLVEDAATARQWQGQSKMVARAPYVDVMAEARADSALLQALPRGGLLHVAEGGLAGLPAGADPEGWLPVKLADGRQGFARQGNLMPLLTHVTPENETQLREALATTALSYLGTQYRWGGKTPQGIDCSGLVSMAYLLNGAVINRDAAMGEGFALKPVAREALGLGDVIYFNGHAAMYLGDDQYVHATGKTGSDAVVINSLSPTSPFYREDLAGSITACGSLFG